MNLKILKPYETGKGILIEQDAGYISPTTEHKKSLDSIMYLLFSVVGEIYPASCSIKIPFPDSYGFNIRKFIVCFNNKY